MKRLLLVLLPISLFVFSCAPITVTVDIPTYRYELEDYIFNKQAEDYIIILRKKDGVNYYLKSVNKGDGQRNLVDETKIDDIISVDKLLYLCSPEFDTFLYSGSIIKEQGAEKIVTVRNVKGGTLLPN